MQPIAASAIPHTPQTTTVTAIAARQAWWDEPTSRKPRGPGRTQQAVRVATARKRFCRAIFEHRRVEVGRDQPCRCRQQVAQAPTLPPWRYQQRSPAGCRTMIDRRPADRGARPRHHATSAPCCAGRQACSSAGAALPRHVPPGSAPAAAPLSSLFPDGFGPRFIARLNLRYVTLLYVCASNLRARVTVGQIAIAIAQARRTENLPEPARFRWVVVSAEVAVSWLASRHSMVNGRSRKTGPASRSDFPRCALCDLTELNSVDPPRGFGRDS